MPAPVHSATHDAKSLWNELEHPRDSRGRFITKGAKISIPGGLEGIAEDFEHDNAGNSRIKVKLNDGREGLVRPDQVTVLEDGPSAKSIRPAATPRVTRTNHVPGGAPAATNAPSVSGPSGSSAAEWRQSLVSMRTSGTPEERLSQSFPSMDQSRNNWGNATDDQKKAIVDALEDSANVAPVLREPNIVQAIKIPDSMPGSSRQTTLAGFDVGPYRSLYINGGRLDEFATTVPRNGRREFYTPGAADENVDPLYYIVAHEMGHATHAGSDDSINMATGSDLAQTRQERKILGDVHQDGVHPGVGPSGGIDPNYVRDNLSGYGATNGSETIAESFAESLTMGPESRPLARDVTNSMLSKAGSSVTIPKQGDVPNEPNVPNEPAPDVTPSTPTPPDTPTPNVPDAPNDISQTSATTDAHGTPINVGDRVTANGRSGTVTSVRGQVTVFKDDEGRNRSARHERVTVQQPEQSPTPTPDETTPDVTPDTGVGVPSPPENTPDVAPAPTPDGNPPQTTEVPSAPDVDPGDAPIQVGDQVTRVDGRNGGTVTSVRSNGLVVYRDPESNRLRSARSSALTHANSIPNAPSADPSPDPANVDPPNNVVRQGFVPDEARAQMVQVTLDRAHSEGQDTLSKYFDSDSKTWAPDRAAQHDQLLNDLYSAAANVPNDRKGIMSGGLGGAGKTYTLRQHPDIDQSQYLTINADDIKEEMVKRGMLETPEGLTPMEAASLMHEESSYLSQRLAEMAYSDGKNVIWDITMSSQGSVQSRVDRLHNQGYDVKGIFVSIPVERSVSNAMGRWERGVNNYAAGRGLGGRYVPPDIIRQAASDARSRSRNEDTFNTMRTQFDDWELWDNDTGGKPRMVTSRASTENPIDATPDPEPDENGVLPETPVLTHPETNSRARPTVAQWRAIPVPRRSRAYARRQDDQTLHDEHAQWESHVANAPRPSQTTTRDRQAIIRADTNRAVMRDELANRGIPIDGRTGGHRDDVGNTGLSNEQLAMKQRRASIDANDATWNAHDISEDMADDGAAMNDPNQLDGLANSHDVAKNLHREASAAAARRRDNATDADKDRMNQMIELHDQAVQNHATAAENLRSQAEAIRSEPATPPEVGSDELTGAGGDFSAWGDRASEIQNAPGMSINDLMAAVRGEPSDRARAKAAVEAMYNRDSADISVPEKGVGERGHRVKINRVGGNTGVIVIDGVIKDSSGNNVGHLTRTLYLDPNNRPEELHNDYLSLDRDVQGAGIASDIYRRQENWATREGVPKVTIQADIDVGGFAWARKGFDWDHSLMDAPSYVGNVYDRAKNGRTIGSRRFTISDEDFSKLEKWAQMSPDDPNYPTPWDLSQLGYTPGAQTWAGKSLMLGTNWMATKDLTVPPKGSVPTVMQGIGGSNDIQVGDPINIPGFPPNVSVTYEGGDNAMIHYPNGTLQPLVRAPDTPSGWQIAGPPVEAPTS